MVIDGRARAPRGGQPKGMRSLNPPPKPGRLRVSTPPPDPIPGDCQLDQTALDSLAPPAAVTGTETVAPWSTLAPLRDPEPGTGSEDEFGWDAETPTTQDVPTPWAPMEDAPLLPPFEGSGDGTPSVDTLGTAPGAPSGTALCSDPACEEGLGTSSGLGPPPNGGEGSPAMSPKSGPLTDTGAKLEPAARPRVTRQDAQLLLDIADAWEPLPTGPIGTTAEAEDLAGWLPPEPEQVLAPTSMTRGDGQPEMSPGVQAGCSRAAGEPGASASPGVLPAETLVQSSPADPSSATNGIEPEPASTSASSTGEGSTGAGPAEASATSDLESLTVSGAPTREPAAKALFPPSPAAEGPRGGSAPLDETTVAGVAGARQRAEAEGLTAGSPPPLPAVEPDQGDAPTSSPGGATATTPTDWEDDAQPALALEADEERPSSVEADANPPELGLVGQDPIALVGRYTLFEQFSRGGMATVHLARLEGAGGFKRAFAVKRLRPHLLSDGTFRKMLLKEAQLAARVRHPNVIPMLDVVSLDNELLLVMEYVHGESLAEICRRLASRKEYLPIPIAASILHGALLGLHAVHDAKDEQGKPLQLIHRDFTPQNIMVGSEGLVRVFDFGVAKALEALEETRPGQLKGKAAYTAPEQIRGGVLGPQVDVFAGGVVLWESLTLRRLFRGQQHIDRLHRIMEGDYPLPSTRRPEIPPELDAVVMRALALNQTERFRTALEFADVLAQAVTPAPAHVVSQWLRELCPATLEARAEMLRYVENWSGPPPKEGTKTKRGLFSWLFD